MRSSLGAMALFVTTASFAGSGDLEVRVQRLENILRSQNLGDLVLELQRVQRELQTLRGELELQRHEMETLRSQQRDLYLDLDRRLGVGSALTTPAPIPVPSVGAEPAIDRPEAVTLPSTFPERRRVDEPATIAESSFTPGVSEGDKAQEQAEYDRAYELLKQRRYDEASTAFEAVLARYPGGSYADNAQYWLAEASYVRRDFDRAGAGFERVIQQYPTSPKVPGALLKIGYIQYEQKQFAKARDSLTRLTNEYPETTEARLAANRLDKMRQEGR